MYFFAHSLLTNDKYIMYNLLFRGGYYCYNFLFLGMLIKLTGEVPFLSIPMISHRLFFTFLKADIFTRSLQSDIWLVVLALPCSDLFLLLVSI